MFPITFVGTAYQEHVGHRSTGKSEDPHLAVRTAGLKYRSQVTGHRSQVTGHRSKMKHLEGMY